MLRNLSKWTHDLQHQIGLASMAKDEKLLSSISRHPQKYYSLKEDKDEIDWTSDMYAMYKTHKFWEESVQQIFTLLPTLEDEALILELLATLNRLTCHDLPAFTSWNRLIYDQSVFHFFQKTVMSEMKKIDIILEIIILCTEVSKNVECAHKLFDTNLISHILSIWEECGDDEEIHLQTLALCEQMLRFEEIKSALLFGTGKMNTKCLLTSVDCSPCLLVAQDSKHLDVIEYIFESADHENTITTWLMEKDVLMS